VQLLGVNIDLHRQYAQHLPIHLNRDVGIAFHSHPVASKVSTT